jgi:nondiscriminating aspartyl-tRNA synthetase
MARLRTLSSELSASVGRSVFLSGWVHRIRNLGGVRFLLLRDRAGIAQVVVPADVDLQQLGCECVIAVDGVVQAEPRAAGGFEVLAARIERLAAAQTPPIEVFKPIVAEQARLETVLDHRAISLRVPDVLDIFRIEARIAQSFRSHLNSRGFTEIMTPKLVLAGAEGGSAVFEVAYYDRKAYLGQSPQFYKQIMVGSGLERVFEIAHAYRAEKSETSRHLTEFISLDFEMGFIESEQDLMAELTSAIRAIFGDLRTHCATALKRRGIELNDFQQIPQIDFLEAKKILASQYKKTQGVEGDLDTEAERFIGEYAMKVHASPLVFVTGYSVARRPAYTLPLSSDPSRTASFDLLYHGVEICTGGQRIHDYDQLLASFQSRGLNPQSVDGYLEAFRHGMPRHGGMGLGLERFVKQMLKLGNVKEAALFPRDPNRLTP